jgi:hypothetical protein
LVASEEKKPLDGILLTSPHVIHATYDEQAQNAKYDAAILDDFLVRFFFFGRLDVLDAFQGGDIGRDFGGFGLGWRRRGGRNNRSDGRVIFV